MKLCTFAINMPLGQHRRVGVYTEAGIVDTTAARAAFLEKQLPATAAQRVADAQVPGDLADLLGSGPAAIEWVAEAVDAVMRKGIECTALRCMTLYDPSAVTLLAPIPRPPGIACFATWKAHIEDSAAKGFALKFPAADSKIRPYYKGNPDSVAGPNAVLSFPSYANELDVECELAAVIGTGGKDLSAGEAERAIAGYCIFNDVSVREIQMREMELGLGPTKGKDHDGGNIFGPWLVTPDEIGDVADLCMSLHVNGEEWSSYSTRHMTWGFPDLVSYLSRGQTLHPGHILTSGSYPGGSALDLNRRLHAGDTVELRISGIGSLINRIAGTPAADAVIPS